MLIKTEWTFRLLCYNNPSQKQAGALCCDCTVQHVRLCFLSLLCQLSNKFIILRLKRSNDANVLRVYSTCVDSMFPERESSEAHCSFPSRWCWSYFHWFLGNPPLCPSEEHVKEYFRAASQPWLCSSPCCVLSETEFYHFTISVGSCSLVFFLLFPFQHLAFTERHLSVWKETADIHFIFIIVIRPRSPPPITTLPRQTRQLESGPES